MSSTKYASPLRLSPRPSRILTGLLVLVHGGALVMVGLSALPLLAQLAIGAIVLLSLLLTLRQTMPVKHLTWKQDGEWVMEARDGESRQAQLHVSSYAHPWLVVLNFHVEGRRRLKSVVLFPDALPADSLRRLRVRLSLEGAVPQQES